MLYEHVIYDSFAEVKQYQCLTLDLPWCSWQKNGGWRRSSVVRTSVFPCPVPDLWLTTLWINCPL